MNSLLLLHSLNRSKRVTLALASLTHQALSLLNPPTSLSLNPHSFSTFTNNFITNTTKPPFEFNSRRYIHNDVVLSVRASSTVSRISAAVDDFSDEDLKKGGASKDEEGLEISKLGIADEIVTALAKKGITKLFPIQGVLGATGIGGLFRRYQTSNCHLNFQSPNHLTESNAAKPAMSCFARAYASQTSTGKNSSEHKREISKVEGPFDAPTYDIPQKPVTFIEGASYSLIILAGLGVAALAAYAVFTEIIFTPKEYKVFGIALKRVQKDSQVSVRIGSPITGYGQDSRNRAARQRIPHRVWTDEDGIEHVEINFFVRGPHGYGKVFTEMFKDKEDKQWKFTFMIVEIDSPSKAQLMLESYIPGAAA